MLVYTILQMYTCRKHFPESPALSSVMVYILQVTRFLSLSFFYVVERWVLSVAKLSFILQRGSCILTRL